MECLVHRMLPTTAVFVMVKLERARVGSFKGPLSQCRSESLVALPFVDTFFALILWGLC